MRPGLRVVDVAAEAVSLPLFIRRSCVCACVCVRCTPPPLRAAYKYMVLNTATTAGNIVSHRLLLL